MSIRAVRRRVYEVLEIHASGDRLSGVVTTVLAALIVLNVVNAIMRTSESLNERFGLVFDYIALFSILAFTLEYILRVWSCTVDERYRGAFRGRLKFATRTLTILDLISFVPFYLPFFGADLIFLRLVRLIWISRLLRHDKYSEALGMVMNVLKRRRQELTVTVVIGATILVIASALMYFLERDAQPEKFSSIPASMWWAVQTLTTVGYGDIIPVTPVGRILGGIIAALGIGLFGLPAGILGSGLVDEMDRRKKGTTPPDTCPHCGEEIPRDHK